MRFDPPLIHGTLIRRYKRFLADIRLDDGTVITAHCANTGSMLQMAEPESPVMIGRAANPDRATKYDWHLVYVNGHWAGINTAMPNILLEEGFWEGRFPGFQGYDTLRREVRYGVKSRADALITGERGLCYVEAKNVTLVVDGCALFPDAVTSRGAKHLEELMGEVEQGNRGVMFLLSQRMDCSCIGIAESIDPVYAGKMREALDRGVEVMAWRAVVTPDGVTLDKEVPFIFR